MLSSINNELLPNGGHWPTVLHTMDTFILYWNQVNELLGVENALIKKVRQVATRFDISTGQLRLWSGLISENFRAKRNARESEIVSTDDIHDSINKLCKGLARVENKVTELMEFVVDKMSYKSPSPRKRVEEIVSVPDSKDSGTKPSPRNESLSAIVQSESGSVFSMMMNASKKRKLYDGSSLKGVTISKIIRDYEEYQLKNRTNYANMDNTKNFTIIDMVYDFVNRCNTGSDNGTWAKEEEPDSNCPAYQGWIQRRMAGSIAMAKIAMARMDEIERHVLSKSKGPTETTSDEKSEIMVTQSLVCMPVLLRRANLATMILKRMH